MYCQLKISIALNSFTASGADIRQLINRAS
jgi:hypothetical protein